MKFNCLQACYVNTNPQTNQGYPFTFVYSQYLLYFCEYLNLFISSHFIDTFCVVYLIQFQMNRKLHMCTVFENK